MQTFDFPLRVTGMEVAAFLRMRTNERLILIVNGCLVLRKCCCIANRQSVGCGLVWGSQFGGLYVGSQSLGVTELGNADLPGH